MGSFNSVSASTRGDVVEKDGDLFGTAVNVAARLEGLAQPGGVVVSSAVRDMLARNEISEGPVSKFRARRLANPYTYFTESNLNRWFFASEQDPVPLLPTIDAGGRGGW